jgi:CBS domain-containing protein
MSIVRRLQEEKIARLDLSGFEKVGAGTLVSEVLKRMRARRVSAVLVESQGRLVGIFTERDVLTKVVDAPALWEEPVEAVMTAGPQTISPDQPISDALRLMNAGHYRNVPVLDAQGRIAGNLPQHEVIRFLTDQFPQEIYNLPPDPERIAQTREGA